MDTVVVVRRADAEPLPLLGLPGARLATGGAIVLSREAPGGAHRIQRVIVTGDPALAASAASRPADILALDAREGGLGLALEVLDRLCPDGALSGPVLPDRMLAIVSEGRGGAEAAFELGRRGVGHVLVRSELAPSLAAILTKIDELLARRGRGRIAICLAGGGIEGLLWELGVLRALDSGLVGRSIVDLDFFCGISAGAILGALLANGIGPDEIARALLGQSKRIEPIGRMALFDLDLAEIARRLLGLLGEVVRGGVGPRGAFSSLARAVPPAAFAGQGLERWMARQLSAPGMSDRWDGLRRPLYVGATDQDTSEAVVFSARTSPEVPIHAAVRASSALVPFYAPKKIGDRWYVDGGFSRTTNMRVAVEEGATLAILIDPLVPIRSAEPGYVRARGGIHGTMQGLKALINGRAGKAVQAIRAMFPDVAFHLFRPESDDMRVLAGSPMKVFYRQEIVEIAHRSTLDRIATDHPTLARDFGLHGVRFRVPPTPGIARVPPPAELDLEALGILDPAAAG